MSIGGGTLSPPITMVAPPMNSPPCSYCRSSADGRAEPSGSRAGLSERGAWGQAVPDPGIELGGTWRARGARAYNGGLGVEPPVGSRGRAPGQGSVGPWSGVRGPLKLKAFELSNIQWKRQKYLVFSTL